MQSAVSVSKGIFVYKNGTKHSKNRRKSVDNANKTIYSNTLWYQSSKNLWSEMEEKIQSLNNEMFSEILSNLIDYVKSSYSNAVTEVPTAALLTGINMPDHAVQFKALQDEIHEQITSHVAILNSEDCQNLKSLVESVCNQLIGSETDSLSDEDTPNKFKKSQCSFSLIQNWYESLYNFENLSISSSPTKKLKISKTSRKVLIVIFRDFEGFAETVLQDFIQIASSYINTLPFVLIFGVSTSLTALHRSLPYHVSSKISLRVFHSQPSTVYLNNVLEKVLFSDNPSFNLGGKVFNLFTDIFLFYDLSVSGFIQNLKYAILEHFCDGNAMAICYDRKIIKSLSKDDLESVRRLLSFRKLVESELEPQNRIKLLTDDSYLRLVLDDEVQKICLYLQTLHLFIKCLLVLVGDLPRAPLGTQIRELYSTVVSKNLINSKEYKECYQLLKFQSKDELCLKLTKIISKLTENVKNSKQHQTIIKNDIDMCVKKLKSFLDDLNSVYLEEEIADMRAENSNQIGGQMNRKLLKEKLVELSKQTKPINKYEQCKLKLLDFLTEIFENYLREPSTFYFHEIFFFDDISIQQHLIGSQRAAIHSALVNPQNYLQCNCCKISDRSKILATMPDISITYKLHLEYGKMINLYDWLQAFISIVEPQRSDQEDNNTKYSVKPELQARFTQAVTELEYLGFIKNSKRKIDHVQRLTWGE